MSSQPPFSAAVLAGGCKHHQHQRLDDRPGVHQKGVEPVLIDRRLRSLEFKALLDPDRRAVLEFGTMVDHRQRRRDHLTIPCGAAVARIEINSRSA